MKIKKRERIISLGSLEKEIPTELMLFDLGLNETTKGPVYCDTEACRLTLERFRKKGLDKLCFDYGHGMVYGTDHRAAAWFIPEARAGQLWATHIEWTPAALTALKDKEYRFYSPFCAVGYEDNRIRELMNVALLCMPATLNQKPIVLGSTGSRKPIKKEEIKMDPETLKLLGALGCQSISEIQPKVTAMADATSKALASVAALTAQVATLTASNTSLAGQIADSTKLVETTKRDALILSLSAAGKLPPALHAWAKEQPLASLESFGAAAPPVTTTAAVTSPSTTLPSAVTPDAIEVLQQFGLVGQSEEFAKMQKHLSETNGVFIPGDQPVIKAVA